MKVINFGSMNIDHVYKVPHIAMPGETIASQKVSLFCGGKGLNQSVALARAGMRVWHAGTVGNDGDMLLRALQREGVQTEYIHKVETPTGHAMIQLGENGENSILLFGGANRQQKRERMRSVLEEFGPEDWIVLQNEINEMDFLVQSAKEIGMTVVLNPSPYEAALQKVCLPLADYILVNEVEGGQITGCKEERQILEQMRILYPKAKVVLTLGSEGAVYQDGDRRVYQKGYPVPVVDTTAAGDTFTGYFLAETIFGKDPGQALDTAAAAAALAVSKEGAMVSIPVRAEVEKML